MSAYRPALSGTHLHGRLCGLPASSSYSIFGYEYGDVRSISTFGHMQQKIGTVEVDALGGGYVDLTVSDNFIIGDVLGKTMAIVQNSSDGATFTSWPCQF